MSIRKNIGVGSPFQFFEVDGTKIAVSRRGPAHKAQTVICLHAIGHGGRDFESFVALTKGEFDLVCVDWPSQGCSDLEEQPASIARYTKILKGVVEQLEIINPIIVGCSIGGAVAINYAHSHPVRALVLCNSGGLVPYSKVTKIFCLTMSRFFAAGVRRAFWYPFAFRLYYRSVLPSRNALAQRRRIVDAWQEIALTLRQAWSEFATPNNDLTQIVTEINAPILVAWAMQDKVLPFALSRRTIGQLNNSVLRKFEGGHAAFLEQPLTFTREFRAFVHGLASVQA